jgi:hypothetical protein
VSFLGTSLENFRTQFLLVDADYASGLNNIKKKRPEDDSGRLSYVSAVQLRREFIFAARLIFSRVRRTL